MTTYENGLLARIAIRSLYKLFKRDFCGFPPFKFRWQDFGSVPGHCLSFALSNTL